MTNSDTDGAAVVSNPGHSHPSLTISMRLVLSVLCMMGVVCLVGEGGGMSHVHACLLSNIAFNLTMYI